MANLSAPEASNVTAKTIGEHYAKCLPIHRRLQDAQATVRSITGELRAAYKLAKDNGVNQRAIARLLKERTADPDEVLRDLHDYTRMGAITGAFPREQISMFSDIFKEDDVAKQAALITMDRIYDDGVFAGAEGKNRTDNRHLQGSEEYEAWDRGWIEGQRKLTNGLAPKARRGRPPKPKTGGKKGGPKPAADGGGDAPADPPEGGDGGDGGAAAELEDAEAA